MDAQLAPSAVGGTSVGDTADARFVRLRAWSAAALEGCATFLGSEAFQAACLSAAVHSVSLVVIALFVTDTRQVYNPPMELEVRIEPPADRTTVPEMLMTSKAQDAAAADSGGGTMAAGFLGLGGTPLGPEISAVEVSLIGPGGGGVGGNNGDSLSGSSLLKEVQEVKDGTSFFGSPARGRRFAFVVDTSGSMSQESRWVRAKTELIRSLKELSYGQEYFVAFFNHQTFAMPQGKLTMARPQVVSKTVEWIHGAVPTGATDPWPALQMAIRQRPDAIFLLTDGLFDDHVVQSLENNTAARNIPIHTIGFSIDVRVPPEIKTKITEQLTKIAKLTGGTYSEVP